MGANLATPGADFCLEGFQRLIVCLTRPPPARGLVHLEFTFGKVQREEGMRGFVPLFGTPEDRIGPIRADLGSYRLRPRCGVRIVAEAGEWAVAAWRAPDPCFFEETLWWTPAPLPPGPWVPSPFYHRLRILSGTIVYRGAPMVSGFDLSLPASGADLVVVGGAVVQLGFNI